MAASAEVRIACNCPREKIRNLIDAVVENLIRLNAKYRVENVSESAVTLRVGVNMLSLGEDVTITAEDTSIHVVSRCVIATTIFDFGKNKKNVELVSGLVRRELEHVAKTP